MASGKQNKILLVDDAIDMVKILKTLLETNGYEVETAFHGLQALDRLKSFSPDLIILDMDMPKMGGVAFYHEICNLEDGSPKFPVLIFTGRGGLQSIFKDLKIEGFMTKPFELQDLLTRIDEVFSSGSGAENPKHGAGGILKPGSSKKVMIVDSDPENFDRLVVACMNGGYEVVGPLDGRESDSSEAEQKVLRCFQAESPGFIAIKIESMNPLTREFQIAAKLLEKSKPLGVPVILYGGAKFVMDENLIRQIIEASGIRSVLPNSNPDRLLQEINQSR